MFGLIIAVLYAAYLYIISNLVPEVVYLKATNFLFWWCVVWAILWGMFAVFMGAILSLIIGRLSAGLSDKLSGLNGLLGLSAGGAISALFVFFILIGQALWVGGAYLLSTALMVQDGLYHWDYGRLVLGGLLVLIALLSGRSKASFSKNKN